VSRDRSNEHTNDNDQSIDLDHEIALITRDFRKLLKMKHERDSRYQVQSSNQKNAPHDRVKKDNKANMTPTDISKIQCYKCREFGHFANSCPSGKATGRSFGKKKANISITWDDTDDESDIENNDTSNHIVFASSFGNQSGDSDSDYSSNLDGSIKSNDDTRKWKKNYYELVNKHMELKEINKDLQTTIDHLNDRILIGAEDYMCQEEMHEKEKKNLMSKIENLETEYHGREEKYKLVLEELDKVKIDLASSKLTL